MYLKEKPDPKLKGIRNGNCNRTACQAPGATGWHTGTLAWYCEDCTHEINFDRYNRADAVRLYGIPQLIVDPNTITPEQRAKWAARGIFVPDASA